jgi:hypothetical protein
MNVRGDICNVNPFDIFLDASMGICVVGTMQSSKRTNKTFASLGSLCRFTIGSNLLSEPRTVMTRHLLDPDLDLGACCYPSASFCGRVKIVHMVAF